MRAAALISQMTPPPGEDEEFDAWYRDEHVPARMRISGFLGAVRGWAVRGDPRHLVVYELRDLDVLSQLAYRDLKEHPGARTEHMLSHVAAFTRFTCEQIGDSGNAARGRYFYLVTFEVPPAAEGEFDAWYAEDHVPTLMASSHWQRIRRFAVSTGDPAGVTRIALHEIDDLAALDSPERAEARASGWRARLASQPWFDTARYAVYERAEDYAGIG